MNIILCIPTDALQKQKLDAVVLGGIGNLLLGQPDRGASSTVICIDQLKTTELQPGDTVFVFIDHGNPGLIGEFNAVTLCACILNISKEQTGRQNLALMKDVTMFSCSSSKLSAIEAGDVEVQASVVDGIATALAELGYHDVKITGFDATVIMGIDRKAYLLNEDGEIYYAGIEKGLFSSYNTDSSLDDREIKDPGGIKHNALEVAGLPQYRGFIGSFIKMLVTMEYVHPPVEILPKAIPVAAAAALPPPDDDAGGGGGARVRPLLGLVRTIRTRRELIKPDLLGAARAQMNSGTVAVAAERLASLPKSADGAGGGGTLPTWARQPDGAPAAAAGASSAAKVTATDYQKAEGADKHPIAPPPPPPT